jgi:hypothetical protein
MDFYGIPLPKRVFNHSVKFRRLVCVQNKKGIEMRLTPPKNITFWVAVILVVLGILGKITTIPVLTPYSWWFVLVGFIVLMLGNLVKGL